MDKLNEMFNIQKKLQVKLRVYDKIKNKSDKQQYVNQMLLAIFEETVEVMRKTSYKNPKFVKFGWKKNQKWDNNKFKEEIIDLWHFLINLCLICGMDSDEFFKIYLSKNEENFKRQKNNY